MRQEISDPKFFIIPSPSNDGHPAPLGNPEDRTPFLYSGYVTRCRPSRRQGEQWMFSLVRHLGGFRFGPSTEITVNETAPRLLSAVPPAILVVCETQLAAFLEFCRKCQASTLCVAQSSAHYVRPGTRFH